MQKDLVSVISVIFERKLVISSKGENEYFHEVKDIFASYGYKEVPEFFISLITFEKLKKDGLIDNQGVFYMLENLSEIQKNFFKKNSISYYFGDLEQFDNEVYIDDFSNHCYFLSFDFKRMFLYGKVKEFHIVNNIEINDYQYENEYLS